MICNQCRCQYDGLACPGCAERKSREAYLRHQLLYVDEVLGGRMKLNIARIAPGLLWHLALFNERTHAYCGALIEGAKKRDSCYYPDAMRDSVCEACREALTGVVAERKAATV
jgi:hypothetical protein